MMKKLENKTTKMRIKQKHLLMISWIISIFYALAILIVPILYIFYAGEQTSQKLISEFIRETFFNWGFRLAGVVTFVFWIYNIIAWNKHKDSILHLLLLLFLNVLYIPIYFLRINRKKNSYV